MKKLLFLIFIAIFLFSCKKDAANDVSTFQGTWTGTYTSVDDNGTFIVSIDIEGKATGSASSMVFSETFQLTGLVASNGNITLTFGSLTSGGIFTGKMNGNTASGTWENKMTTPNYSGTWIGKKQ